MKQFYPLSTFLTEYSEKNGVNAYRPVAVGRYGIRTRESIYSKELAKDYSKNKLIHKNTLTVGMGSVQIDIGVLTDDITYSVSPAYHTYKIAGVNAEYLRYCLECRNQDMFSRFVKRGSRQGKTIDLKRWMTYEIPVYDENRQQEIVDRLNRISELIEKRQEQLVQLSELVKSRFIELFGDYDLTHPQESWAPIKEVGTVVGGATPKTDHDEYWGGSYRWITPAELDADSGYIYDSVRKLTKAGVESCSLQEMPVGTVILSSRAPIGKVAIAGNTFYCNQGFKNIICKEGITPRYLYTVLLLNVEYLNSLGRGATFKEISKGIVESIRIPVPSMELQEQFAAFVEQTDKSKLYGKMEVAA